MYYTVTTHGYGGSVHTVGDVCEGEMLDRVRMAMASSYIESVTVTKD